MFNIRDESTKQSRRPGTPGCSIRFVFALALGLAATARGAGPADPLFRLVPPDASLTLAVEDLRGHARDFLESPLSDGLRQLPAVRAWFASDRFQGFQRARREIEKSLGVDIAKVRDDLIGEAVVLTVWLPPGGRQDEARGLLLTRVRDRGLLDRLVRSMNASQQENGELAGVTERKRGAARYFVRRFRDPLSRPNEYYATLDDQTFAWSNSEDLVLGAIDRQAGDRPGLGTDPRFQRVRSRLPERAAASLFLNPSLLVAMAAAAPKPPKPADERLNALFARALNALEFAGAAIEWRDGLILHAEAALNPKRLGPWARDLAALPAGNPLARSLPPKALAVATARLDFGSILDLARALTPEADRPRLDNLRLVLKGLLLGEDPASLLTDPHLGSGVLIAIEAPGAAGSRPGFPVTAVVNLGDSKVVAPLDNALRTILALRALDTKQGPPLHVETREIQGRKVTALDASSPFAYAIDAGRLVLGTSSEGVANAFSTPAPAPDSGFARLQARYFPKSESFACVDLELGHRVADAQRAELARQSAVKKHVPEADAARDLDQALALLKLFQAAYFTSDLAPDATSVHQTLGLIVRPASGN